MLKIVNMIPNAWSDEENQDCEPNLSVNQVNPSEIIGTAFTFDNPAGTSAISPAMTGNWAPFFSSVDGGDTWTLQFVLPSATGDQLPTWDVTSRYGGSSGEVYSGLISPGGFTISASVARRTPARSRRHDVGDRRPALPGGNHDRRRRDQPRPLIRRL